jgi:HEAT repeat protein
MSFEQSKLQAQWSSWISSLRTNGMNPQDVLTVVRTLTNDSASIRLEGTKVLRQIGIEQLVNTNLTEQAKQDLQSAARSAVPGLIAALKDPDAMVRANAAITLGFLREQSQLVVPALVGALGDEENRVALSAAKGLARLKSDARSAIPALLQEAQSADSDRRAASINAIKQIDPEYVGKPGFD